MFILKKAVITRSVLFEKIPQSLFLVGVDLYAELNEVVRFMEWPVVFGQDVG